jgi:hypothetical protein
MAIGAYLSARIGPLRRSTARHPVKAHASQADDRPWDGDGARARRRLRDRAGYRRDTAAAVANRCSAPLSTMGGLSRDPR